MRKEKACWAFIILSLIGFVACLPCLSFAGDVDILMRKLVEKGILTKQDAEGIMQEIGHEGTKQEKEMKKEETKKVESKEAEVPQWAKNLPDIILNPPPWIKNIKPLGDLRLRYQTEDREGDSNDARDRFRYRLRLGVETKVMDELKVGFGLASGSGDPRSTNQTFDNTFDKDNINIDYAFAEYSPVKWLSLTGGKMHNPIYRPSDLLWDSDITPEGASGKLNYQVIPELDLFFNTGAFVLDERSTDNDPWMVALQPGLNWKIAKDLNLKLAFAYYMFGGVKDNTLDFSANTNTRLANGKTRFDYDAPAVSGEIGYKKPFGLAFIPYLGLFGEYVDNTDTSDNDKGYIAGLRAGHQGMTKFGDWSFEYSYRSLQKDAWPDVFPDSDFHGGETDVKGHEAILNFALWKNIWMSADYYRTRRIIQSPNQQEDLFQLDFNIKF